MIHIIDKSKCCGCNACVQRCPKQCITMQEDEEGFLYPVVDQSVCIDCGLCEKVCPVINPNESRQPLQVFAAKNRNEYQRLRSSSGGIFILLAGHIIKQGGVVFGARFDKNWEVEHAYAETLEELEPLMRSKYVQSRIGNTYKEAEQFLKQGRQVMFVGTPCQIAGLKKFLRKEYENLLAVDFICHGVPSPRVWRRYLEEIKSERSEDAGKNTVLSFSLKSKPVITGINFREKQLGGYSWKKFGFVVHAKSPDKGDKNSVLLSMPYGINPFMRGFLANLYLRPSCYKCPVKAGRSTSDLTIGDFWGIHEIKPNFDDDKGVSSVLVNTIKGQHHFQLLPLFQESSSYEEVSKENPALIHSVKLDKNRRKKFYRFYPFHNLSDVLVQTLHVSFGELIWRKLCYEYNRMISIINKR